MKYSQTFWDEEDRLTRLEDDPTVPYRTFEKEKSKMPSVTVSEYVRLTLHCHGWISIRAPGDRESGGTGVGEGGNYAS